MMQYKLRDSLISQTKVSYAKDDDAHAPAAGIDCSAGSNPFFMPDAAKKAILQTTVQQVNLYPHYGGLKEAVCRHFAPAASLSNSNILLTSGSIEGISLVNTAFLRDGARVLGICPQFSDYMSNARLLGYDYQAVPLRACDGYSFDKQAVLQALDGSFSLVYIDNPNNPTGQIFPLGDLRDIALAARDKGVCVVIDEAYGDFMPDENSALTLLGELDNVIVLRTFSKGWGLAGLRAGYLAASPDMIAAIGKLSNPYVISEPARRICEAALRDELFLPGCRQSIAARKTVLQKELGGRLHLARTADTVPICLILHEDAGCDLQALLAREGVIVVSGGDFLSLSKNSVRLRLPDPGQFDALMSILTRIDRG